LFIVYFLCDFFYFDATILVNKYAYYVTFYILKCVMHDACLTADRELSLQQQTK